MIVAIAICAFAVTLMIGVPIAFAMGLVGASWIVFVEELEPSILARRMYGVINSFPLLAIPLFSIMGLLAERSGLLNDLVRWLDTMLGRMRGGMAYINIAASMVMGGVSGTAVSDVAALGRLEIRMMTGAGFPPAYSAALTASSAVIAPIIPPSVAMVIFGLAAGGVSIGGLFMAGIVPGLLMGLGLWAMAWFAARKVAAPSPEADETAAPVSFACQTARVLPFLLLPAIIVGGIAGGFFTVTESAAIGVVYMLLVGFVITRTLRLKDLFDAMIYSAMVSAVVGMLMGAGGIVSWIFTRNQVTHHMTEALASLTHDPTVFMVLAAAGLLVLGTVMEASALIVAMAPLLVPIAREYGIDDLQFGTVFVFCCMIGMITPPVGILLFMTSGIAQVPLERLYVAILPTVAAAIVLVGLLIAFPALTLFVPGLLGY